MLFYKLMIPFMLLFALVSTALVWMHFAIRQMERSAVRRGQAGQVPELPEMQEIHGPKQVGALGPHLIEDWRPEEQTVTTTVCSSGASIVVLPRPLST